MNINRGYMDYYICDEKEITFLKVLNKICVGCVGKRRAYSTLYYYIQVVNLSKISLKQPLNE